VLRRCYLVVLCLCRNADFPQLLIDILHKRRDSLADRSEVMIIKLLSLRRHRSEKCASCIDQVFSLLELLSIHEEVLLLRSYGRRNFLGCSISEQSEESQSLFVDRFHGSQKRCLLVKRFSCVGAECCRDAQSRSARILSHERRRGAVPRCISSRLECSS